MDILSAFNSSTPTTDSVKITMKTVLEQSVSQWYEWDWRGGCAHHGKCYNETVLLAVYRLCRRLHYFILFILLLDLWVTQYICEREWNSFYNLNSLFIIIF